MVRGFGAGIYLGQANGLARGRRVGGPGENVSKISSKNNRKSKFSTKIKNKIARNFSSFSHFRREFCRNLKNTCKSYPSFLYSELTYIKQKAFEISQTNTMKKDKSI